MDKTTAENILNKAAEAQTELWRVRRPTKEMLEHFGSTNLHPFIEIRLPGAAYAQGLLEEDYGDNEALRETHIDFLMLSAKHLAELAQFWLDNHK